MSSQSKLGIETVRNIWCHNARPVRFLGLNGLVALPMLAFGLHVKVWTAVTLVILIVAMAFAERKGYSPTVALLVLRAKLSGKRVSNIRRVGHRRQWVK